MIPILWFGIFNIYIQIVVVDMFFYYYFLLVFFVNILSHHSSQVWHIKTLQVCLLQCLTWTYKVSLFLTLASLGKEWPSFLWTHHWVRSPRLGAHSISWCITPCTWLCRAFRCKGGNVLWNWCPCHQCASPPSSAEYVTSLTGELPLRCGEWTRPSHQLTGSESI